MEVGTDSGINKPRQQDKKVNIDSKKILKKKKVVNIQSRVLPTSSHLSRILKFPNWMRKYTELELDNRPQLHMEA